MLPDREKVTKDEVIAQFGGMDMNGKYCSHCHRFGSGEEMYCYKCGGETHVAHAIVYKVQLEYECELSDILRYLANKSKFRYKRACERGGISFSQGDTRAYQDAFTNWLKETSLAEQYALEEAIDTLKAMLKPEPKKEVR
jgi:RNA polymerase subunit RPABC4/transcription elongation factor Spt4